MSDIPETPLKKIHVYVYRERADFSDDLIWRVSDHQPAQMLHDVSEVSAWYNSDLVDELVKASNEVIDNWYSDNSAVYNRFVDAIAAIEQGDGV